LVEMKTPPFKGFGGPLWMVFGFAGQESAWLESVEERAGRRAWRRAERVKQSEAKARKRVERGVIGVV
jgi:hypothetical protein